MNRLFTSLLLIASFATTAARTLSPVGIDSVRFELQGDLMVLKMNLDLERTSVKSSAAQIFTPLIVSASGDTLPLHSVGVYGHGRYINFLRNDKAALSRTEETTFEEAKRPHNFSYLATTPYQSWMADSKVIMQRRLFGCANCLLLEKTDTLAAYHKIPETIPPVVYFEAMDEGPVVESLDGSAFIDFVVDRTDINPGYRKNPRELAKIRESIDTVLNDKDVTITGVWLKGFASPESPYAHNTKLAQGRVKALKDYISQLYKFNNSLITTDYEPEDWEGLKNFVAGSNIDNKDAILEIIDSDMAPDPKEALIKSRYPKEYNFMLANFYPALRHTEYRITYEVKRFDDLDKIREVMRTKPNRLTLREFLLLGKSYTPGSPEFNEVFETAVRMYPDNPTANINAANAAMQRKDLQTASKYLENAGNSREATYARGSLAFLLGNYEKAESLFRTLPDMPEATVTLKEIELIRRASRHSSAPRILE